jgi:hypothetical protein
MKGRKVVRLALILLLTASVVIVNLYFAWTSHVLSGYPSVRASISSFAVAQMNLIGAWSWFIGAGTKGTAIREFIDYEVVAFTLAIAASSFLLFLNHSLKKATLRMLEIGSLSVLPLGLEIYVFDYREFWIHASIAQVKAGFLPWFSNADLLFLTVGTLSIAAVIELRGRIPSFKMRSSPTDATNWE